jgi:hypothetical protein
VFTEAALHREVRVNDQTISSVETVFARGESGVQIGIHTEAEGLGTTEWGRTFGLGETESMYFVRCQSRV